MNKELGGLLVTSVYMLYVERQGYTVAFLIS